MPDWKPSSWRAFKARQMPLYPDQGLLKAAENRLSLHPPLVPLFEISSLKVRLAEVAKGRAFLLQGGDCAESFADFNKYAVLDTLQVLMQMAEVLTTATSSPVVRVARIAGQFAKPRSINLEERNGQVLPSYRGDIINGIAFTEAARTPDPGRMLRAVDQATKTLKINKGDHYTCHEALLLPYEQALTRRDTALGEWYGSSAHMLWLGYRTSDVRGAHAEYLSGIANPIGLKIGPETRIENVLRLIEKLNPENQPGKLTLVTRYGAENIANMLPALISEVRKSGAYVVWSCDPMHGNTIRTAAGLKTRPFDKILAEVKQFFEIHRLAGTHAGGIHLELTGQDVTECIGGAIAVTEKNLKSRYHTYCDPRLNADQALELASLIAKGLVAEWTGLKKKNTSTPQ